MPVPPSSCLTSMDWSPVVWRARAGGSDGLPEAEPSAGEEEALADQVHAEGQELSRRLIAGAERSGGRRRAGYSLRVYSGRPTGGRGRGAGAPIRPSAASSGRRAAKAPSAGAASSYGRLPGLWPGYADPHGRCLATVRPASGAWCSPVTGRTSAQVASLAV